MDEAGLRDLVRTELADVAGDQWGLASDAGLTDDGLIVTVDTVTAQRHLPRGAGYEALARLAIGSALSDLAAAGARPIGCLLGLIVQDGDARVLRSLLRGAAASLDEHGTVALGGDTKPGPEHMMAVTALGRAPGPALTRAGARVGDVLLHTGTAGKAWPLVHGRDPARWGDLVQQGMHTRARLEEGVWLAEHGARACADTSDGVLEAAWLLAEQATDGPAGARLDLDAIPLANGVPEKARRDAIAFGGDHELVIAMAPDQAEAALDAWPHGPRLMIIGEITAEPGVTDGDGEALPRGYQHTWDEGP